ncbi:MAG: hypothetical protein R3C01_17045 [Planctomycetaceae bacterium]
MSETYQLKHHPPSPPPSSEVTSPSITGGSGTNMRSGAATMPSASQPTERLVSLDAYRGFIMILLAASGFGIASFAKLPQEAAVWHRPDSAGVVATDELAKSRKDSWSEVAFHFNHPNWRSDFLPYRTDEPDAASQWFRVGVSGWDLIQPAFMFMVGVAMPFSYRRRNALGESPGRRTFHALARSLILVLMGVFLYSIGKGRTNWIFPNVLAQIGLGYFFVYLLLGRRWWIQLVSIAVILGGTCYFMQAGYWRWTGTPVPNGQYDFAAVNASVERGEVLEGRFAPWSKNDNAFHYFDLWLLNLLRDSNGEAMTAWRDDIEQAAIDGRSLSLVDCGRLAIRRTFFADTEPFIKNSGGYQTLNFVPSMATMLLGVLMGQLLMSDFGSSRKLLYLFLAGLACLILGRILGNYVCPVVKRIWTPSWALLSGAYVIWMLGLFYLLFDLLPLRRLAIPLTIVGMNSIAMYLMGQLFQRFVSGTPGDPENPGVVGTHLTGLIETVLRTDPVFHGRFYLLHDDMFGRMIAPTATLLVFWCITLWMYRRRIFLRI